MSRRDPQFEARWDGLNIEVVVDGEEFNIHPWDAKQLLVALTAAVAAHDADLDRGHG